MKSIIKKSLLIVAVLATVIMNGANFDNNVEVNVIDSKFIDLKMKNSDGGLTISVKDSYGESLHVEKFEGILYTKKYDLQTLPMGNYYFEVDGATKINVIPFKVTFDGIEFNQNLKNVYYKPTIRQDGDLVYISKVAFNKEDFTVYLYDKEANVLHKEELNKNINIGKTLNLIKLEPGTYSVVMIGGGKVFEQKIYKK